MRYNIDPISGGDIRVAEAAQIGAEVTVMASYEDLTSVGSISITAPTSGTFAGENSYTAPSAGHDMQLLCANGVRSAAQVVVTLGVTFADDTAGSAVATFNGPQGGWGNDTTFNLPQFLSVDIIGAAGNSAKKIKTVNSLTSIAGGSAGAKFDIVALPVDWIPITCSMNKEPTLPVTKSMPIRCGYNPSRFTKKVPGDPGSLSLTTKRRSYADGLERLNGHRVSIMLVHKKDDALLTERNIFTGVRFMAQPKFGDGEAEAEVTAEGNFEGVAIFV